MSRGSDVLAPSVWRNSRAACRPRSRASDISAAVGPIWSGCGGVSCGKGEERRDMPASMAIRSAAKCWRNTPPKIRAEREALGPTLTAPVTLSWASRAVQTGRGSALPPDSAVLPPPPERPATALQTGSCRRDQPQHAMSSAPAASLSRAVIPVPPRPPAPGSQRHVPAPASSQATVAPRQLHPAAPRHPQDRSGPDLQSPSAVGLPSEAASR